MKLLEERIRRDGKIGAGNVLKVDSFLNHQMDVPFLCEMGKEFHRLFGDEGITKVLTIEASGIGIAALTAQYFGVPVLFAKKTPTNNISGDIYTAADALSMMAETGCDGVMIARGAMGNPWVFSEICAALDGRDFTLPSAAERFEVALAQVREMITEKGERVGVAEARKHLSWYCHGMEGAAAARSRLMQAVSYDELAAILREMGERS